jgi:hypothetical protein
MQTGQNVHDPLTQLNSHLGFGAMAGLNPFGAMGLNPNDPNMVWQDMITSFQYRLTQVVDRCKVCSTPLNFCNKCPPFCRIPPSLIN